MKPRTILSTKRPMQRPAPRLLHLCLLMAALAGSCSKAGRSLVNVDVTADATVLGLDTVQVTIHQNDKTVRVATVPWTAPIVKVGIYLPSGVSGTVTITAIGLSRTITTSSDPVVIAHSEPLESQPGAQITVTPGQATAVVALTLKPGAPPTNGGTGGSGATGGTGGTAGSGGSGGGQAGSGGSGAGGAVIGSGGNGAAIGTGGGGVIGTGGATGTGGAGGPDGGTADTGSSAGAPGRSWSTPETVENDRTDFDTFPKVAMNASGSAVVIWQRGSAVWARTYDGMTRTWGTARSVAPNAAYGNIDVGIDDAGNAMAIWVGEAGGTDQGAWWSRSTNKGVSWSAPRRLSPGRASGPTIAVAANGTALAAWTENPGNNLFTAVSSDFRPGAADWNATLNTPQPGLDEGDRNPRVALDAQGRGFLIWENPAAVGQTFNSIWIQRYDTTWLRPSIMTLESYGDLAYSPNLALNDSGAATAIWLQRGASTTEVWSRRFAAGAWLTPEMVAMGSVESDPVPEVSIAPSGSSVGIWGQALPTSFNARASRHPAGATTAWEAPEALEANNTIAAIRFDYVGPIVRMDGDGNAIAVWRKKTSTGRIVIHTARLAATATAWSPAGGVPLHDDGTHTVSTISLAASRNGTAIAVWTYGPEDDIWTSIFR